MRNRWFTCLIVAVLLVASLAAEPATAPDGRTELPAFGVWLPPSPEGFERVGVLGSGMLSATIAAWQRADPDLPTDTKDAHKQRERIYLAWRPLGMHYREGIEDHLREAGQNPTTSVRFSEGHFFTTAREVKVPHPTTWPTVRFERPDGTPDASKSIVCNEAVAANNVVYVLMHAAPREATPEAQAAFDEIAAGLRFAPPAALGKSLRVVGPRRPVPGVADVIIQLLEPFRGGFDFPSATAHDLTMFTHRPAVPDPETEDYIAYEYFADGGPEIPKQWIEPPFERLKERPAGWLRDETDLRIARPLPKQSHGHTAFVGGRKLAGTEPRALWTTPAAKTPQPPRWRRRCGRPSRSRSDYVIA